MLSRVADSLFWMSRYLERAEQIARLVHVHLNLRLEQPAEMNATRWSRVRATLNLDDPSGSEDLADVLDQMCFNPGSRSSIVNAIMAARANARQVREQISSEMWEQINRLYHHVRSLPHDGGAHAEPEEFLESVMEGAHLFRGLTDSTMSHGHGWHFIQLGQFLERSLNVASIMHVHFQHYWDTPLRAFDDEPSAMDYPEWIGILKSATAFEAYCKVHTPRILPRHVADFLLLSPVFPHSIRFSVERMQNALVQICDESPSRRVSKVLRLSGRLQSVLSYSQVDEVLGAGLDHTLADVRRQTMQIHAGLYQAFISYPVEAALEV
jgi:uncharacterized alpha-E superfamily protein